MKNELKIYTAVVSLFNIAQDLAEIEPDISDMALVLSKRLSTRLGEHELSIPHDGTTPHNTQIAKEVQEIVERIQSGSKSDVSV